MVRGFHDARLKLWHRSWRSFVILVILAISSVSHAATGRFQLISATWGAGMKRADVVRQLQTLVKNGGLHLTATTTLLGDPAPGPQKELVVVYEFNGTRHTERIAQNERLSIGAPPIISGDARVRPDEVERLHGLTEGARDVRPTATGVEIVKDGSIRSREKLTVPVRIDTTAATDSTNIRLYFGDRGIVIFNWELNQDELRYHSPPNGDLTALGGKGHVPTDTWMHISWIIEPTKATLLVDGQPRMIAEGNYAGLSGTAGIGTHEAALQVTQFDFTSLAGPGMAGVSPAPFARVAVPIPGPVDVAGPRVPIRRTQAEIKALYVREEDSGEMLGLASELILTATHGSPRGYTPVTFVSPVGDQMTAVLDDVLRSVRVKYPKWAASKVELSFEDRYTPKDGGSIGAAIGTLLLSMIQGFEIDPNVAITGDVTADGKLRQIGGIAAKMRGATAAKCDVMIVPAGNYDQVVDAMVYEGPAILTDIQVIGAETLTDATEVARADRDAKLGEALDLFGSLMPLLKKSPAQIHSKDVQEKLARVLALAPDHISAKLLLQLAQNKEPRKLSATASLYYTFLPVRSMLPAVFEPAQSVPAQKITPIMLQKSLVSLRKLRGRVDPKVNPVLDSMIDCVQTLNAVNNGTRPPADLDPRRQRLIDALERLQSDRPLMEKMLHEGI